MKRALLLVLAFGAARVALAQFSPAILQNDGYWNDGKAEYNIYAAEIVREGATFPCEVVHILMREPFDAKSLVRQEGPPRADRVAILKLNQILHLPAGLLIYQQMHSSFWRVDNAQLLKFSLTSSDSSGNTYKDARREGDGFVYDYRTYWDGAAGGTENVSLPANGYFYDELPWLVRTLDFSKANAPFEIQLASSVINSRKDTFVFQTAKISFAANERAIDVSVEHTTGTDHFILDRDAPHLLREWKAADGSHLKMKRNLKVDYLKYNKPGDRERALKDPMLRLPD